MSDRKWWHFGEFRFDGRLLYREPNERLELSEKEARVLSLLIQRRQHLLEKKMLLAAFCDPEAPNNNLDVVISKLRRTLGDGSEDASKGYTYIDTVRGDGFVFIYDPVRISYETRGESLHDYHEGLEWWNAREPGALLRANGCFDRALGRDPDFAEVHAARADCFAILGSYWWLPPSSAAAKAKASARKALTFNDDLASPYATYGFVRSLFERKWSEAEADFMRATARDPKYATARHWHALHLAAVGEFARAIAEIEAAEELDPLSRIIAVHSATIRYWARDYEAAEKRCRTSLRLYPSFWYAHYQLGLVLEERGRPELAIAEHNLAIQSYPDRPPPMLTAALARAYAQNGDFMAARKALETGRHFDDSNGPAFFHVAMAHGALGDPETALEQLRAACSSSDVWVSFCGVDPRVDGLRQDRRFDEILAELHLNAA